jgi:Lysozyme like domain
VTTYTYSQLEGLWTQAGGSSSLAPLMAAIAMAESGGNPDAKNTAPCASDSYATGLWQICMPLNSQYVPGGDATNAASNAAGAVAILKNQGLTAWSTYSSGAYKQYYNGAVPPTAVAGGTGTGADATTTAATSNCDDTCLWCMAIPGLSSVPLIGGMFQTCLLRKTEARAMIGAGMILLGGLTGTVGVLILAAYGFKASGAASGAGRSLEAVGAGLALVPGAEIAGAAVAAGGSRVRSTAPRQARAPRTRAPARPAEQNDIPKGTYGRRARPAATGDDNGLPQGEYGRAARPRAARRKRG